jgi:hypothetical protein
MEKSEAAAGQAVGPRPTGLCDDFASLFSMNDDFSTLRSPTPKPTMENCLRPAENVRTDANALVQRDFQQLYQSSPMPKVVIEQTRSGNWLCVCSASC